MARQARIVMPGAAHHVTQRGNYRQDVFFTPEDRRLYLRYLRESARKNGLRVLAYCLMTNHVHLVVVPDRDDSMRRALGRAHLMYAQHVHRLHDRAGHMWQNRFYSNPMDDAHAWNAAAYVELNPVRAGITRQPWTYPWSSAAVHCGKGGDSSGVLDQSAWPDGLTPEQWRDTLRAFHAADADQETLRAACRTGHPLGSDAFLSQVEARLGHRLPLPSRGRPKGSKDTRPRMRRTEGTE